MSRFLALSCLFALASVAHAAEDPSGVRKLVISPRAAPKPALRYELLPRLRDSKPGNRALEYARAFELRPTPVPDKDGEIEKKLAAWQAGSIDTLPVKAVKDYLQPYSATMKSYDFATQLETYNSETLPKLRIEGIALLLPGVQRHREVIRQLALRHRVELAEHRYDDAARTLQTLLRAAKDVGEDPTLIQMLVGLAITNVTLQEIEQWIQRPDSPNLYWALTALPRPFVDPRPAIEGETVCMDAILPNFKELEKGPITTERANSLLAEILTSLGRLQNIVISPEDSGDLPNPALAKLALSAGQLVYVTSQYDRARKFLIDDGMKPEEVARMAPAQVVMLRSIRVIRGLSDDQRKCFLLPYPQGRAEFARLGNQIQEVRDANKLDMLVALASMILPAMDRVHESVGRTERRLAALRVLEAIRLHAAANAGKPPKSLADITLVAITDDPITGKPFTYQQDGQHFTLIGPPPEGKKADARNSIHYDVTLR